MGKLNGKPKGIIQYNRITSTILTRTGRKCSKFGLFIALCSLLTLIIFSLAFISDKLDVETATVASRLAELPTWNSNQSVHLSDYLDLTDASSYLLSPRDNSPNSYCGIHNVKFLILVTTSPANYLQREAIRQTWGTKEELSSHQSKLLFMIGKSSNQTIEDNVESESREYGDIIQENFLDTYHNLTLKSIALLKWVNLTCSALDGISNSSASFPEYVIKVDDDIFINMDRLGPVTKTLSEAKMIGRLICGAVPVSDPSQKIYMPKYLYPGKMYPGYLSGTAYILRGEIVPTLLRNALTTPLIHLEDIYVTGILARQSNILPEDSIYFTYGKIDHKKEMCVLKQMINSHQVTPTEMYEIWSKIRSPMNCAMYMTGKKRKEAFRRPVPKVKNMNKRLRKLCLFP